MSSDSYTFIVVGFRVDQEKSVYYRKCKSLEELKQAVENAFTRRHCDFISVRMVKARGDGIDG